MRDSEPKTGWGHWSWIHTIRDSGADIQQISCKNPVFQVEKRIGTMWVESLFRNMLDPGVGVCLPRVPQVCREFGASAWSRTLPGGAHEERPGWDSLTTHLLLRGLAGQLW